jgi:hypothetical protein
MAFGGQVFGGRERVRGGGAPGAEELLTDFFNPLLASKSGICLAGTSTRAPVLGLGISRGAC